MPGGVSIGAHGGRYTQEPSGHKRYIKEGQISGTQSYKKSIRNVLKDIIIKSDVNSFVRKFKERKKWN